jgi:hypothetical protein
MLNYYAPAGPCNSERPFSFSFSTIGNISPFRFSIAAVFIWTSAALPSTVKKQELEGQGFQWKSALVQAGMFASIQHGFRIATEPSSRQNLKGPFFRDWMSSARSVRGWRDGDPHIVNYVGHPMMGATSSYIFVQNDPRGRVRVFGRSREYWASRLRALAFSAAYGAQFELGPFSESSIGNVGIDGKGHSAVDLVVTPVLGLTWQATEDAVDRLVVEKLKRRVKNRVARLALRAGLNPSRSFANALRFKVPWHRDTREPGVSFR